MGHIGFDLRDYSTDRPVIDALVLIPRRSSALAALAEAPDSSYRARERRNFHSVQSGREGIYVAVDVDGSLPCDVRVTARGYHPVTVPIAAPMDEPLVVRLQRHPAYAFASADTVIRGNVTGAPFDQVEVELIDPPVPNHRVPLDARGDFVIFAPEKRIASLVTLNVHHPGGMKPVGPVAIEVNQTTVVTPAIAVP